MADKPLCSVEGCDKAVERREWCSKHYQRWMRHGDTSKTHRYEGATCTLEGCDRPARAYGLCGTHDMRKRRHGDPHARPAVRRHGCLVEGCGRKHGARGYCVLHYQRLLFAGDVKANVPPRLSPGTRQDWLIRHIEHDGEACLIWPFSRDHRGYGRAKMDGVAHTASRIMCELVNGAPASPDLQSAHNCGNGHLGCVHPRHLRWDTVSGNHADKIEHGTHIQGEAQGSSKLTEADVLEIRALQGRMLQREIGERFGIAQTTVRQDSSAEGVGMAQGSFSSAVSAWVKETKERQVEVRNLATERVIEAMQEPGPSMATAAKAVAGGVGLGKVKKDGSRGVSKRAFGPITNPGGAGNIPVDSGFLRASLVVGIGTLNLPTTRPPENATGPFDWDEGQVNLVLSGAKMTDAIEARYQAVYARKAEYGGGTRRARRFVGLASQQWGQIVDQVCAEVKSRAGG